MKDGNKTKESQIQNDIDLGSIETKHVSINNENVEVAGKSLDRNSLDDLSEDYIKALIERISQKLKLSKPENKNTADEAKGKKNFKLGRRRNQALFELATILHNRSLSQVAIAKIVGRNKATINKWVKEIKSKPDLLNNT